RNSGPQLLRHAVERGVETSGTLPLGIRLELDRAGERMPEEAGERTEIGERPVDVAAELGGHRNPLGRRKAFDPALRRDLDVRFGVVENAGGGCRNLRLDMLC